MNILVIRMHRFGDILQVTPMLQGLKQKFPDGSISFLTGSDMTDLISCNPDVDEVFSIPEKEHRWFLKNRPEQYSRIYNELYDFLSELRQRNFQLIINRQYEFGGLVAWLLGAKEIRGGAFSPERGFVFTDDASKELFETVRTERSRNSRNLVDWGCRIAGVPLGCGEMLFRVPGAARSEAQDLLSRGGAKDDNPLVAVQMGAARSFRQWGTENYARVIEWLIRERDRRVVLLGSEDERGLAEATVRCLGSEDDVINLTGKTDFKTLGGVLERCQYLITGDTGTMHMAASVGTPVLALFYGTAYPWETGPYGTGHLVLYADEPCSPCLTPEECPCGHRCLKAITPRHVCAAFDIAESMRGENIQFPAWPDEAVRLFVTRRRSGSDQLLIPVNNCDDREEGLLPLPARTAAHRPGGDDMESAMRAFSNQRDLLVRRFCLGDRPSFIGAFSELVDRLHAAVRCLDGSRHHEETLARELMPTIEEVYTAFQSEDFVTVLDIVQYRLAPVMEGLIRKRRSHGTI